MQGDEEFGDENAKYCILDYSDAGPPFPKSTVRIFGISGYRVTEKMLNELPASYGDVMMALESEVE